MSVELVAVYAGLTLLAGLLLADGGRDWRLRLTAIVVAPLLAFALWQAAQAPKGWPTSSPVPASANFLWGAVREPDPQTGDQGRIFLWLDVGGSQPRAFALPYTRRLHRQLQSALTATKHGHQMSVTNRHGKQRPHGSQRGGGLHFYPHPALTLPPK